MKVGPEEVYSKREVERLIATAKYEAIEEAREIDRASMARHNWTCLLYTSDAADE